LNIFGKYSVMLAPVTAGVPFGEALGGYPGGAAGARQASAGATIRRTFSAAASAT
jgi:hypothetical protein